MKLPIISDRAEGGEFTTDVFKVKRPYTLQVKVVNIKEGINLIFRSNRLTDCR